MEMTAARAASLEWNNVSAELGSGPEGLGAAEAASRLSLYGPNILSARRFGMLAILWRQLRNPLLLLLAVTAATSIVLGEHADAFIILAIITMSAGLGFVNEYRSEREMHDLHARVRHHAIAVRDGRRIRLDVAELVPGDAVEITTGDIVPADLRLCQAHGLEADQSVLTGEPQSVRPLP